MLTNDLMRALQFAVEDLTHCCVELHSHVVADTAALAAYVRRAGWVCVGTQPGDVAHSELLHHHAGDLGRLLEIVGAAHADVTDPDFLGHTATEEHTDVVEQLLARRHILVLPHPPQHVPKRVLVACGDGDALDV